MKIVIAGGGRVGSVLASRLVAEQHTVTVIERDASICTRLFEEVGVVAVCGDATSPQVLEAAGVASADVAAGVLARDSENLAFAMLVRSMSPARIMVRMLDTSYREAYRLAGVKELVAEAEVVVAKMTTAIDFPQVAGSLPLGDGDTVLFELALPLRARVAGQTVAQVRAMEGFPRECIFIGMVDPQGRAALPDGSTVLKAGHTIILVARRAQLAEAVSFLTAEPVGTTGAAALAATLRKVDFLAPLNPEELETVARGAEHLQWPAGTELFRQGDAGESFYVVLAGEVQLRDTGGQAVATVKPGGFFGELALLTGEPRTATAVTATACELAAVGREDFRSVVMANPGVALEMSRILGERLSRVQGGKTPTKRWGLFGR
ncbi:cyclic nucleotide-binding domain-containing protein [Myxococcus sp. CA051A]|uniref:NAD-binding protein n=1 Tax=unclassified Myxococcus TaxID=2648731 RepID=UPI00157B47F8|nr:cyclic nucleotide-binding domain-containing protein [Myxococcus sp. CA056]NTX34500.1 cyclic nucleotide-binding domain-containing protein [Myxococcus sp. CA033]NTX60672.1 cyclic nucleotide-binding domain-containing protein [Myxococcus sp. CA051A]